MGGIGIPRGLTINSEDLTPGYILFNASNSSLSYLVDRNGILVKQWKGNYRSGLSYLMDDGSIVRVSSDPDFTVFAGGGESGRLQKINWEGKMIWDYEFATEEYLNHHDIAIMPNGNILAIAWEAKTAYEARQVGRRPELMPEAGIWPDWVVEIEPQGRRGGRIIWEWHSWDHMIQDYDPGLSNYGVLSQHPELIDINAGLPLSEPITQDSVDIRIAMGISRRNLTSANRGSDTHHSNAINYNVELDQIAISVRRHSEIWIIDHGITTEEAAGHEGGRYDKGGDLLYRWGNPQNYNRGDSTDQKLYFQHDVRWIEKGYPGAGNLTIFNNDIPGGPDSLNYSTVIEITPPMEDNGDYIIVDGQSFGPVEPVWSYVAPDTISFFSSYISGAQRMKNGNTLINSGAKGRFFEVTTEGEIVWEYLNQYRGDIRRLNGDPIPSGSNPYAQFRVTFIPADHPALQDKDLKPLDPQPKIYENEIEGLD
jgi:hypothetical protein